MNNGKYKVNNQTQIKYILQLFVDIDDKPNIGNDKQ
jgi:hypothetical protein